MTAGTPTASLVEAALMSIPGMVMQKFHNLRALSGVDSLTVPRTLYEIIGTGEYRRVILTPELHQVAADPHQNAQLRNELGARWSILEPPSTPASGDP